MIWRWSRAANEYTTAAVGVRFSLEPTTRKVLGIECRAWRLIVLRGSNFEWKLSGFVDAPSAQHAAEQIANIVAAISVPPKYKPRPERVDEQYEAKICELCETPFEADASDNRTLCMRCEEETGCRR